MEERIRVRPILDVLVGEHGVHVVRVRRVEDEVAGAAVTLRRREANGRGVVGVGDLGEAVAGVGAALDVQADLRQQDAGRGEVRDADLRGTGGCNPGTVVDRQRTRRVQRPARAVVSGGRDVDVRERQRHDVGVVIPERVGRRGDCNVGVPAAWLEPRLVPHRIGPR